MSWPPISMPPDTEAVAEQVFAALADPSRRAILAALASDAPATATDLADRFKSLVEEGNARKVSIKRGNQTVAEFPLTFGVIGAIIAPAVAIIGALTAAAVLVTLFLLLGH